MTEVNLVFSCFSVTFIIALFESGAYTVWLFLNLQTANDQEEEEQGETFDVIITKLKPESDGDQVDGDDEKGKKVSMIVLSFS